MTTNEHQYDQDAQLTAYVLGELSDDEKLAVERRIQADDSLREEVESIRRAAEMLKSELADEPAPGLTSEQRRAVAAGSKRDGPVIFTFRRAWAGVAVAAAACIVVAVYLTLPTSGRLGEDDAIALRTAPEEERSIAGSGGIEDAIRYEIGRSGGDAKGAASGEKRDREQLGQTVVTAGDAAAPPPSPPTASPESEVIARYATSSAPGRSFGAGAGGRGVSTATELGAQLADRFNEFNVREIPDGNFKLQRDFNREAYGSLIDNPFKRPTDEPLSTFSIDVDTASYSNMRRFIDRENRLPPLDAVRIEELINYFSYDYEPASGDCPFSVNLEVGACPWNSEHRLVRIGLRGEVVDVDMRPATSLVFLLDVSGSMNRPNKLPLLKESIKMLVNHLLADDRVAIVVYAGAAGLVLDSTYCDKKPEIIEALDRLRAGGSTAGGAGIELAYKVAQENYIEGGVNRVILCTDGDFNVGVSDEGGLIRLIEEKRETGVFLSVLGFGTGNFQDQKMEMLSNKGNGNFAYIDTLREAKKVLIEEMGGTLVTIAKDVKIQVDFNPAKVGAYRLIGYANRLLEAKDFDDDTKDAGEIGAGHTVTALYEIIPADGEIGDVTDAPESDFIRPGEIVESELLLKVKLRYKEPHGDESELISFSLTDEGAELTDASPDYQFAAAVAAFGMLLRDSEYKGNATWATVLDLASAGLERDPNGFRAEFVSLVEKARKIVEQ